MSKVICASLDCNWCDDDNCCTAEEIHMNDLSIMTAWEGRQHLWKCKKFEMSDDAKRICEEFKKYANYPMKE